VLTTWHPLHFAEDYALVGVLAGGRRTEERESPVFGVNVGYQDSEESGIGYLHS
jgi:hypothetical protein